MESMAKEGQKKCLEKAQKQCEQLYQRRSQIPAIGTLQTLASRWYLVIIKWTFQGGFYQTPWHTVWVTNVNYSCPSKCIESDWAVTKAATFYQIYRVGLECCNKQPNCIIKFIQNIYLCADRNRADCFFSQTAPHYWWLANRQQLGHYSWQISAHALSWATIYYFRLRTFHGIK